MSPVLEMENVTVTALQNAANVVLDHFGIARAHIAGHSHGGGTLLQILA